MPRIDYCTYPKLTFEADIMEVINQKFLFVSCIYLCPAYFILFYRNGFILIVFHLTLNDLLKDLIDDFVFVAKQNVLLGNDRSQALDHLQQYLMDDNLVVPQISY